MKPLNRESLKNFFRKGQLPNEMHFAALIDSTVNKLDDGFNKTDLDGLRVSPINGKESVMSFFENELVDHPSWQFNLKKQEAGPSLSLDTLAEVEAGKIEQRPVIFFSGTGNVGLGTDKPRTQLEVGKTFSTHTRVGAYAIGKIDGDGKWHDILSGVDQPSAFEVLARIDGKKGTGKYALTHAIAVCTYAGGRNKISQTRAYFGWFFRRIELRWEGGMDSFRLQARTRQHYGYANEVEKTPFQIRFHITSLWDESIFLS